MGPELIGAGISALSSLFGGSSAKKAAREAARIQQQATDQILAQQRALFEQQRADAMPFYQSGVGAADFMNRRVLGYSPDAVRTAVEGFGGGPNANVDWGRYVQSQPDVIEGWNAVQQDEPTRFSDIGDYGRFHYGADGSRRDLTGYGGGSPGAAAPGATAHAGPAAAGGYGPAIPERPAIGPRPTYERPTAPTRPQMLPRPQMQARKDWVRPTMGPLDVSADSYVRSPDYEVQLKEGNRNLVANRAALGGLNSGAAMKALQNYGADQALKDYGQWRDFTAGRYDADRNYLNHAFESDRGYDGEIYGADRNFLNANYEFDHSAAERAFENDRTYGERAFESDRGFGNTNYDNDRLFANTVYADDRDYRTGRFDRQSDDAYRLFGAGAGANSAMQAAGQSYGNVFGEIMQSNAQAQAQARTGGAAALSQGFSGALSPFIDYANTRWPVKTGAPTA